MLSVVLVSPVMMLVPHGVLSYFVLTLTRLSMLVAISGTGIRGAAGTPVATGAILGAYFSEVNCSCNGARD